MFSVPNDIPLTSTEPCKDISETVKNKLSELEKEINKFRLENVKLEKLRVEREAELKSLRREIDNFQKEKAEELESIESYREDELKKIKAERRIFDKYQKASRDAPNKQEREEIKELKNEVCVFILVYFSHRSRQVFLFLSITPHN